jgi:teichuronic acid exporter
VGDQPVPLQQHVSHNEAHIKTRVLSALRWTAGARTFAQVINWASTIVVIRILGPEDYGLMAMSQVLFFILLGFSQVGLGAALVQAERISEGELKHVFGFLLTLNVVLFAVQLLGAPLVASAFGEPGIEPLMRVLAVLFLIQPFIVIPSNLLGRDIDFKRRSLVELAASVVAALSVLGAALSGLGVWALMLGVFVRTGIEAIGLLAIRPFPLVPGFAFGQISHLIKFGWVKTLENFAWKVFSQADMMIAGRFFGAEVAGIYSVTLELASLPMTKLMPLLQDVAMSAYSRVKDNDRGAVRYYFVKSLKAISLLSFPVFLGMAAVSWEFVDVVLGEKWASVGWPLFIMALATPLRIVTNLVSPVVSALGRPGIAVRVMLVALVVMPAAFLVGSRWGVIGLAAAWLFGFPLVFAFAMSQLSRAIGESVAKLLEALAPATMASALMLAAVMASRDLLAGVLHGWWGLVVLVAIGVAVYSLLMLTVYRKLAGDVLATFRTR